MDVFNLRGKGLEISNLRPDVNEFIKTVKSCKKLFKNKKVKISFRNYFKGNIGFDYKKTKDFLSLTVNPSGILSINSNVFMENDRDLDFFTFGKFNKSTNNFEIKSNKLESIFEKIESQESCKNCIAQYRCCFNLKGTKLICDSNLECDILKKSFKIYIKNLFREK